MILWIVLTLLVALAVAGLVFPLARPRPPAEAAATPTGILADQLRELEGQAAAGTLSADEASRLKLEIERRMLAEARVGEAVARPLGERALLRLALGLAVVVALGATGLYALLGKPGLPAQPPPAASGPALPADHPGGDVTAMLGQLEAQAKASPNDVETWRMLGWSYFQTGRFGESAEAYARAAKLDPTNPDHPSAQGESLVQAAGGQMTPAASAAFKRALALDPAEPRARYFLAVEKDQAGDRDGAMADWIALVNSAPDGAPWAAEVRSFVEDVARERGVDLTGRLKPISGGPVPRGPTAADIAEAQKMSPDDQQQMIRGMVEGLEERLKDQPRDADGWVRLIRARMVLGEPDAAARALRSARAAFKDSPAELARINEAAKGLGAPGA